jgi:hypothetical protein
MRLPRQLGHDLLFGVRNGVNGSPFEAHVGKAERQILRGRGQMWPIPGFLVRPRSKTLWDTARCRQFRTG